MEKKRAATKKIEDSKLDNDFGSQIRSYVLQPYRMIKDHRTKAEVGDVDRVLDGDLQPFIRAYLLARRGDKQIREAGEIIGREEECEVVKLGPRFLAGFCFCRRETWRASAKGFDDALYCAFDGSGFADAGFGGDEDLAIAALLHDVVEDCGGEPMLKEVRRRFRQPSREDCGWMHGLLTSRPKAPMARAERKLSSGI